MSIRGQYITASETTCPAWLLERLNGVGIKSIRQWAMTAGLSPVTVHAAMRGTQEIGLFKAKKLADALKVPVDALIENNVFPSVTENK